MTKPAAHENPLIPNARLRQMYRAILRARLLGQALPPSLRTLTVAREAALVSSALDLTARDLVLDAFSTPVIDFLRGSPLHRVEAKDRVPHPSSACVGLKSSSRIPADCGSPFRLPLLSDPTARIHAALGAAAALRSMETPAKKSVEKSAPASGDSAIVLFYALPSEISLHIWTSALKLAALHDLPIVFVVLPSFGVQTNRRAAKAPLHNAIDLRAIAQRAGVPAIPVDAVDAVALYRVAQESIGHARIGGGPALIECAASPTPTSRNPTAISQLEQYLLQRGIATQGWMDREASTFTVQVRSLKPASK